MATELIETPAVAAIEHVERGVAERLEAMPAQVSALVDKVQGARTAPVKPRVLAAMRLRVPHLILLAVAAGCIVAFAWWLDATLRPALAARQRHEFNAQNVQRGLDNTHVAPEACVTSSVQWCGAIGVMVAHAQPAAVGCMGRGGAC
ncbi:hypothetical protein [Paraburkholderia acidisoli]|uniref:Uncharacterized protein n=1 Tax=Paraburkholderia acidisoli TaxID=2571748 RepID=A0A7Z2JJ24_9BURK|nr:hypothetical protein [Paraburkholderia acidisoli]QGZ64929.1 hypothetical protein FAZ98_24310 [Paraburkholderia acidisoli]